MGNICCANNSVKTSNIENSGTFYVQSEVGKEAMNRKYIVDYANPLGEGSYGIVWKAKSK